MAQTSVPLTILLVIVTMFITAATAVNDQQLKETNMTVYFQDVSAGPNATVIPVAGIAGKLWSMTQFGTIYVSDDPMTEGPDPDSAPVGRAQGMHVIASSAGTITTHAMISLVFTNEAYNGSTLQIAGSRKHYDVVREDAVVSGTGVFKYARGYVTFETYFADNATAYSVIQKDNSDFSNPATNSGSGWSYS